MNIPFVDLKSQYRLQEDDINAAIQRVLDHGQYIMGPEVVQLETALAEFVGVNHCITVASGTEALLISLMALDIGAGDEVITTPFTFIATAEVIALLGATPVFVDVDLSTANLDAELVEARITERTKAIIPVSLYGQTCDMDALNLLADKHNITVIEDAAQSFGATYKGQRSCGLSEIACTSFFPSKPLGAYGDGGAIFTDNDDIAQIMRQIRVHGQSERYRHSRIGVGGRMDTLQCAIVLVKFQRFSDEIKSRQQIAGRYIDGLADLGDKLKLVLPQQTNTSVWAQFTIRVKKRDEFAASLKAAGIPTAIHYPVPINQQKGYEHFHTTQTPNSMRLAREVLSLPMSAWLTKDHQDHIISSVMAALDIN